MNLLKVKKQKICEQIQKSCEVCKQMKGTVSRDGYFFKV
jgi:hypothetical protein